MLWLLKAAGWAREAAQALFGIARRNPMAVALILAVLAAGWQYRGKQSALAELRAFKLAQAEATQAQIAVNHEPAAKSEAIAEKSNAEAPAYYRRVADAANAHRLSAASCTPVAADLSGEDHAIESVHGPDPSPRLVSITQDDFDKLTYATGRALQMQADAKALIDAGVAVSSDMPSAKAGP